MDVNMIICDLDRTLLRNDKTISEYTLNVLEKCRKMGILFGFATARTMPGSKLYEEITKPDIIITDCGALAVIKGEEVYKALIPINLANQVINTKLNHKEVGIITANAINGYYVSRVEETSHPNWKLWKALHYDFSQGIDCDVYKFASQIFDSSILEEIVQIAQIRITRNHGEEWVMFTHKDATKYNGIAAIAKHLNMDTENIAAFGDDFSDIEMLKNCGIGVAMANAIDEAKEAADYICDSNDNDGVAKWLEENLCTSK